MIYFLSVNCLSVATPAVSLFGLRLHNKILYICDSSGYISRLLLQVFLDNIETFITQLDSTNHVNLFLTELRSDSLLGRAAADHIPMRGSASWVVSSLEPVCDSQGGGHDRQHVPSP